MSVASRKVLVEELDSAESVVVVDHDGLVVFANTSAESLFERGPSPLTGARFGFPVIAGESCDIDIVCNGRVKVTEMRTAAIDWQGRPARLASLRDVTKRRRLVRAPHRRPEAAVGGADQLERSLGDGPPALLGGGQLLATISNSIVAIMRDHYGRGPMKAKTYALDDAIVVVMRGSGFTALEQTIMDCGEVDRVLGMRLDFQRMMSTRFKDTIEELTGCKVLAFLSQAHVGPDITMETFFIDGPLHGFGEPESLHPK
jgi:uncharacterized protein YbcI